MNIRSLVVGIIVVVVIVLLSLFIFGDLKKAFNVKKNASVSGNQIAIQNKVLIKNSSFVPEKIRVKKGTMVTWTNIDTTKHTITFDSNVPDAKSLPFGKDGQYSFTFETAGIYNYHCDLHKNMKGIVEVTE